jgi:hypothetical protein
VVHPATEQPLSVRNERRIEDIAASLPPLTDEQVDAVAGLLRTGAKA